ncbi:unnamed protein product [Calypogeia fissa]
MAAATMGPVLTEQCRTCKSPTKERNRSLCAVCLNRNLQRACQSIVILKAPSPEPRFCQGSAPITRRALFPGMPRAVLGPANLEKCQQSATSPPFSTSKTTSAESSPVPSFGVRTPDIKEADPPALRDASKDSHGQKIELADEIAAEGRGLAGGEEQVGNESRTQTKGAEEGNVGAVAEKVGAVAEKGVDRWHLFQIEKNLTVRIPNPPTAITIRPPGRCQPLVVPSNSRSHYSIPPRKESRPRQGLRPSNVKRLAIKPNVNAEAELMMRLLADSMPILKSTAPLVLPPCKVRPAPVSPVSPPGDPLWKRRSITCPKSLKVQAPPICVS